MRDEHEKKQRAKSKQLFRTCSVLGMCWVEAEGSKWFAT
jgi:hypothetical protein